MKIVWKYFFVGVFLTVIPGAILIVKGEKSGKVLSLVSTPTPTATPTPTPTLTPTPTPAPTPSLIPTPTPVLPPPISSQEVHAFIERFAAQYGVDPNVLRHIAVCESGFNPLASKLSYAGLYQFGPSTWKAYRIMMGENPNKDLRYDAEEATQTAAYVLSLNRGYIWPSCMP